MAEDGTCGHKLSRTLNLCGLYRRTEDGKPEKCWDNDYLRVRGEHCPNNTVARAKAHQEYLYRKPYMRLSVREVPEERPFLKDLEQLEELYPNSDRIFEPEDLEPVETYDGEEAS